MEAKKLNELLLTAFPELRAEFNDYTAWQDGVDTGCFLTYEDLLLPLIRRAVQQKDREVIGRVVAFMETLLGLDDEYAEKPGHRGASRGAEGRVRQLNPLLSWRTRFSGFRHVVIRSSSVARLWAS